MTGDTVHAGGATGGRTVLLVEDEPDVRMVLSILLRRAGFAILEAGNGLEGVELFADRRAEVDVVLMDVMMPVMTGPEALPRLRAIDPDVPVVFHSGYDRGEVAGHLSEGRPYTAFLAKPAEPSLLVDELMRASAARPPA